MLSSWIRGSPPILRGSFESKMKSFFGPRKTATKRHTTKMARHSRSTDHPAPFFSANFPLLHERNFAGRRSRSRSQFLRSLIGRGNLLRIQRHLQRTNVLV